MNSGEFAALCGVEKRTLFHYDRIGLLQPAAVRENGYREYRAEQIYQMDAIKIFQACGYTLAEIKLLLNAPLPERQAHIHNAEARIDRQIRQLTQMKLYLQNKQSFLEDFHDLPLGAHRIQHLTLRYDRKPLPCRPVHYFSFLSDGTYAACIMEEHGEDALCKLSPDGACRKEGLAISFFLSIPAAEPNLPLLIRRELERCDFRGEPTYYVENLPHFLLDDPNSALLKVTVFQRTSS